MMFWRYNDFVFMSRLLKGTSSKRTYGANTRSETYLVVYCISGADDIFESLR